MVVRKRKKVVKYRGSKTHGGGAMKKRRGAGHRGGRGNAGTGKKAGCKMPSIWKDTKYFGKFGFKKKNIKVIFNEINIKEIEDRLPALLLENKAKEEGGKYLINLADIGYNKLLSNGTPEKKMKITVDYASANAVEKIKKAGGEVVGLQEKKVVEKKKVDKPKKAKEEPEEE